MLKKPFKIYIAGKVTGDPNYKQKFAEAERVLKEFGFIVLNPASYPEGLTPRDYMHLSFTLIDAADLVLFLPDYQDSSGALLEQSYCKYIKREFEDFDKYVSIVSALL